MAVDEIRDRSTPIEDATADHYTLKLGLGDAVESAHREAQHPRRLRPRKEFVIFDHIGSPLAADGETLADMAPSEESIVMTKRSFYYISSCF
jgi:hypothetical protein